MFKAGFARVDVTPPLGSPIAGYFNYRNAKTVITPLSLNCIAFGDGEKNALIITGDFLNVDLPTVLKLKAMISEATGVDPEHIYTQALHQHTALRIGGDPAAPNYMGNQTYLDMLYSRYCDVAVLALQDMCGALVSFASKQTSRPLSFIRRYRMKDGSTVTNPKIPSDDIDCPIGNADNNVRLLRFSREGADDIALVNFSTHPDVVGGERICADWPGYVREYTENDIGGTHCILVNGAQGDTNHHDPSKAKNKDPDARLQFAKDMARVITDAVIDMWDNTRPVKTGGVFGQMKTVCLPTRTEGIERIEECKKIREDYFAGKISKMQVQNIGYISRIANLERQPLLQKVTVSTVGFGEVAFIGFGGEPFTEYADVVRGAFSDKVIIGSCCTNGGAGYLPSRQAFEEGGYEANSSVFPDELADVLQSQAKALVEKYIK